MSSSASMSSPPSRHDEIKTKVLDNTGKKLSRYEVFLSFRGEDTRASFVSHLYNSLQNNGICVFKDDHSLQRGDQISTSLLQAIEDSQIAVVVFSKNYANSRWCLQELRKIMECRRTIGQIVLPVFYDLDPSEIRHQTGEFGEAFQSLVSKTGFRRPIQSLLSNTSSKEDGLLDFASWREALVEAASLAGFVVLDSRLVSTKALVSEEWGSWGRQVGIEVDSEAMILILKVFLWFIFHLLGFTNSIVL